MGMLSVILHAAAFAQLPFAVCPCYLMNQTLFLLNCDKRPIMCLILYLSINFSPLTFQ